jgi:hypothetical protein
VARPAQLEQAERQKRVQKCAESAGIRIAIRPLGRPTMRTTNLFLGWICVAALAACGGTTASVTGDCDAGDCTSTDGGGTGGDGSTGTDGGGIDGGTGSDGGIGGDGGTTNPDSGGTTGGCPTSAPSSGACSPVGLECEYGNNADPGCDEIVDCTANGWATATGENCSTQGTCPSTYADVPKNQSCSPDGFSCGYSEGQCNCAPQAMSVHQTPVWQCTPTTSGCPTPRPDLGTACTLPSSTTCDYGACTGGIAEDCEGGKWHRAQTACPADAL